MAPPGNGIFVVLGEMSTLITAMRRGARWSSTSYHDDEQDTLMKTFQELKKILTHIKDLRLIDPNIFLGPFLDVIRSEETTGPVTNLALSAINKFLSYGLIDPTHSALSATVENIADAVTHARFVGTDQASDGVVLMKIIQVLCTLMLGPEGTALTNESVCEIMLSCFRICFEPRLNELLRRTAEHALKDMVLLLFMRLPQFADDLNEVNIKKLKMRPGTIEQNSNISSSNNNNNINNANTINNSNLNKKRKHKTLQPATGKITAIVNKTKIKIDTEDNNDNNLQQSLTPNNNLKPPPLGTTPATPVVGNIVDMQGRFAQTPTSTTATDVINTDIETTINSPLLCDDNNIDNDADIEDVYDNNNDTKDIGDDNNKLINSEDYINSMGIRFIPQATTVNPLLPYGLPCIRELFRFLISLCNPLDNQNTDTMIHMGLSLLIVALEVGADQIGKYDALLILVKDEMCRNLFSLLNTERLTIFAADLQLCFLLFESLRIHLKFQLEYYLTKLSEIISNENQRIIYETRELALDNLLQLWRIPNFCIELYINYDCNLYCTNLFEDITKLLSKNSLSTTQQIYSIHLLSLDALLTIIESIEKNCINLKNDNLQTNIITSRHSRNNSSASKSIVDNNETTATTSGNESIIIENINNFMNKNRFNVNNLNFDDKEMTPLTQEEIIDLKNKKRILTQGTELFNNRPEKGIQFLQENCILNQVSDPLEIAHFLRQNSGLDKKMIGEYISKKKNVENRILETYVKSFDFTDLRIDQALRLYLETFRLPGEAPLIFLVMEHFAEHWHTCNNEPFANTDAAFRLAYAIIMLNMDQHNYNAKRLNIPMTVDDFLKNLRGLNGNLDFDQEMLMNVYNAIKNDEIVMPAEQTGLVRENYLWKVLLRRGASKDGLFNHVNGSPYDKEIFQLIWGPTLAALSFMFDKSNDPQIYKKSLNGFTMSASIASYYSLNNDFDALILTVCKFTTLLNMSSNDVLNDIQVCVNFGQNLKAQLTIRTVFSLVREYGDTMRDSWHHIFDVLIQLFRLKLLPKNLIEVEDFCEPSRKITLIHTKPIIQKTDVGLLSSLYSYLSSDSQRLPTHDEQEIIKISKKIIKECLIEQIITESKFLQLQSLNELIRCLINMLVPPDNYKTLNLNQQQNNANANNVNTNANINSNNNTNTNTNSAIYSEDIVVFLLEILVRILIQNRDRVLSLWQQCRDQLYLLLIGSASYGYDYLLLRTTIALLKLAIYLMRNEELCPNVLQSLRMLLLLKPTVLLRISKQISIGMYELLKTSAQNIHTEADWSIVFTILECVGAGAIPSEFEEPPPQPSSNSIIENESNKQQMTNAKSDGALSSEEDSGLPDRGYISDPELASCTASTSPTENWILINREVSRPTSPLSNGSGSNITAITKLAHNCKLVEHSPVALVKCWDSLAFVVRSVAHITPYNFESCVRCIRTFVEASLNGGEQNNAFIAKRLSKNNNSGSKAKLKSIRNRREANDSQNADAKTRKRKENLNSGTTLNSLDSSDSDADPDLPDRYQAIAIQLLDLMHTLHTRTAQIFRWWAEEGGALPQCSALWAHGWCPLLQGIARLATDQRRQVRTSAITCLQRALLVHDLQTLTGTEWSGCFKHVLFPLLSDLLNEKPLPNDQTLLEESRMRTATIMSKVFLHHLTPLMGLAQFTELWLEILDYLERFMRTGSDMLHEAMLESLKNMLLVMHSVRVFHSNDGVTHAALWDITWDRVTKFLPLLKEELFKDEELQHQMSQIRINQQVSNPVPAVPSANSPTTNSPAPISPPISTISANVENPIENLKIVKDLGAIPKTTMLGNSLILPPLHEQHPHMDNVPILLPQMNLLNDENKQTILPMNMQQRNQQQTVTNNLPFDDNNTISMDNQVNIYDSSSTTLMHGSQNYNNPLINIEQQMRHQLEQQQQLLKQQELDQIINGNENSSSSSELKIPISHLLCKNQYPSLINSPSINIVKSFAPCFIQPNPIQKDGGDIYNDYVNNPYNLTLQSNYMMPTSMGSQSFEINDEEKGDAAEKSGGVTNVFQSANYFGTTNNNDFIPPPGSELLFDGP